MAIKRSPKQGGRARDRHRGRQKRQGVADHDRTEEGGDGIKIGAQYGRNLGQQQIAGHAAADPGQHAEERRHVRNELGDCGALIDRTSARPTALRQHPALRDNVRRLSAGGSRIRTIGSARERETALERGSAAASRSHRRALFATGGVRVFDIEDALAFMREVGLTGPPAQQGERRLRESGDKIKAGEALTTSDNFWLAWWLPLARPKRIDP